MNAPVRARLIGAAMGVCLDGLLGEPPVDPHPVAAFGAAMRRLEQVVYRDSRTAGALHAGLGIGLGAASGSLVGSTAVSTYLTVAGRGLRREAEAIRAPLLAGDLVRARTLLRGLVGRDSAGLDAKEIARAVVESVAENTVDAIVAPVVWAVAGGGIGAMTYRAVNTMDAMVGHHNPRYERYGWAAARLDDVANLVPARLTAALVTAVRPHRATAVLSAVRKHAGGHPSPNAGVAEAAFAAALSLRLGGTNSYGGRSEVRPSLGFGRPAEPEDIRAAMRLSRDVSVALVAVLAGAALTSRRTVS